MGFFVEEITGKVISNEKLSSNINKITINSTKKLSFIPGQYVVVLIGELVPRNYSIASINSPSDTFDIVVNTSSEGLGARTLKMARVGDKIKFLEPGGMFLYDKNLNDTTWFITVGSGISPFIPMIAQAKQEGHKIKLFFGARNEDNLLDLAFLNIETEVVLSKPGPNWMGKKGRVYDIVTNEANFNHSLINTRNYYICGLPQMVKDTKKRLQKLGINKGNIHYEKYGF